MRGILRTLYRRWDSGWARKALDRALADVERYHKPALVEAPEGRRVLVLAPHMDDEIIGCGGTLRKQVQASAAVTVLYLTDGTKGDPVLNQSDLPEREKRAEELKHGSLRKEEARRAAAIIGIQDLIFLDQPDGSLTAGGVVVEQVREIFRRVAPDLVYVPFLIDRHRDHWQANRILVEAVGALGKGWADLPCCGYEVWSPLYANTMVDINPVVETKREALAQFKSQLLHVDYIHGILGLNAYRSMVHLKGRGYAEAFYLAPYQRYAAVCREMLS